MTESRLRGAHVVLETGEGVVLQLRDDNQLWGIFGGLVEDGEEPRETALREIEEELTVDLDPARLTLLRVFWGPRYVSHLFHYPVGDELREAVLTEGIRFDTLSRGALAPEAFVPWHWTMLRWYWIERPRERA